MNKYGNSLANWGASRAEYLTTSKVINFTIKDIRFIDEGQYEFRPEMGIYNTACSRVFILKIQRAVNGGWSEWSNFGQCSVTCGFGTKIRHRTCTNPRPSYGGNYCSGNDKDEISCNLLTCPVHGGWSEWSSYGQCSVTCGPGTRNRQRTCTNPKPAFRGSNCPGNDKDVTNCSLQTCPDGGWSEWSEFGQCSVTCGSGPKIRQRTCTNPRPAFGGNNCPGNETDVTNCNLLACPVHGGWSEWSEFALCSQSCGSGTKTRQRTCTNPTPAYGGNVCSGSAIDETQCNIQPCPVHGGWTEWSNYGHCSKSCGLGNKTRSRTCTNPKPDHGGNKCSGSDAEIVACVIHPCPVNGGWSGWSNFNYCSASCGDGRQTRWRSCDNPLPSYGGINCAGSPTESRTCKQRSCPVDGNWSNWSAYGPCSVSCNTGLQVRTRTCSNPAPNLGGKDCIGSDTDRIVCNDYPCPIIAKWSLWADGDCSVSCGEGTKNRSRVCQVNGQVADGRNCTGAEFESASCNVTPCPVGGAWSSWGNFSACSKNCGSGMRSRTRNCSEPHPQFGGNMCKGDRKDVELCKERECPATSSVDTSIILYIAGVGLVVIVAIVVVSVVCRKKSKSRNIEHNQQRDTSLRKGVEVQEFMSVENPTYAEPDEVDDTYAEIPSDAVTGICYPNSETYPEHNTFQSQYQELPHTCHRDDNENTYTKMFTSGVNHQHVLTPDVSVGSSEANGDKTCQNEVNDYNYDLYGGYITPVFGASSDIGVASSFDQHKRTDPGLVKDSDYFNANDYLVPVTKGKY